MFDVSTLGRVDCVSSKLRLGLCDAGVREL
jgi:hypothetical protein